MWLLNIDESKTIRVQVAPEYIPKLALAGVIAKPFALKPKQGAKLRVNFEFLEFKVSGDGKNAGALIAADEATLKRYQAQHGVELIPE